VAIWRREPSAAFIAWVNALAAETLPTVNALLDVAVVGDAAAASCDVAGLPACENRDRLAGDAAALCFALTAATGLRLLRLRLGPLADGAPSAPADGVAHLVCAFRGEGPEFGLGRDAPGEPVSTASPAARPPSCAARSGPRPRPMRSGCACRRSRGPACWWRPNPRQGRRRPDLRRRCRRTGWRAALFPTILIRKVARTGRVAVPRPDGEFG
jgi:hypothetical protein